MSKREQLQTQIYDYLEANREKFDAPYGILSSIETLGGGAGKVRTITFGAARSLDCGLTIWSVNRISVHSQGPASYRLKPIYHSVAELLADLDKF